MRGGRMVAWRVIGAGLVVVGTCILARPSDAEEQQAPVRSGMQAHVDPATGRFVPEPVGRPQEPSPQPARLPVTEVQAPGGGTMVELDERFMSRMVATVGPDGRVHLGCETGDGPHVHAGQ